MSAFLGPIHFWLYDKIKFQEALTSDIAFAAVREGWMNEDTAASYTVEELQPLEQLIDESNIHGWLQQRIHDAESRYAVLVTLLLKEDPTRIEKLKSAAFQFGQDHAMTTGATPEEAYHALDDALLNGMPCDRVNMVTVQEENRWVWEEAQDIHAAYWNAVDGDPSVYRMLRSEVMRGMMIVSGLTFAEPAEGQYELLSE